MAGTVRVQVTITTEDRDVLYKEGGGNLSKGLAFVLLKHRLFVGKPEKILDPQEKDGRTLRKERNHALVLEERAANDALQLLAANRTNTQIYGRLPTREETENLAGFESDWRRSPDYTDEMMEADMEVYRAHIQSVARMHAETDKIPVASVAQEPLPVQTLQLSLIALDRMGLDATPPDLTDDQIRELNTSYDGGVE